MQVPQMNAGLDAGPIEKMCGAGSVRYPHFGEILASLHHWYLDDATLAGHMNRVTDDLASMRKQLPKLGLHLLDGPSIKPSIHLWAQH